MSYKTAMFALALAVACALVVVAQLSPWVLIAVLGSAALLCTVGAFRSAQIKVDRILLEELEPADDQVGAPVEITSRASRTPVSGLAAEPARHLPQAS